MEKKIIVVTDETIERYIKQQRSENVGLLMVLFWIIFGCVGAALVHHFNNSDSPYWSIGFMMAAIGMVGLLRSLSHKTEAPPEYEDSFALLEKWEKYTEKSAKQFPVTEAHLQGYIPWATKELCYRREAANFAFDWQAELRKKKSELDVTSLALIEKAGALSAFDENIAIADADANLKQRSFLDLWDLVTEEKGIGILKGSKWQNPEKFRKSILRKTCHPIPAPVA